MSIYQNIKFQVLFFLFHFKWFSLRDWNIFKWIGMKLINKTNVTKSKKKCCEKASPISSSTLLLFYFFLQHDSIVSTPFFLLNQSFFSVLQIQFIIIAFSRKKKSFDIADNAKNSVYNTQQTIDFRWQWFIYFNLLFPNSHISFNLTNTYMKLYE